MVPFRGSPTRRRAASPTPPQALAAHRRSRSRPARSAQSPFICVGSNERTFRLFARSEGTEATVLAFVVYETSLGNIAVPVGRVVLNSSWAPSPVLQTGAALASAIVNGTVHVALRFTSLSGSVRIDDVFLDPRFRR